MCTHLQRRGGRYFLRRVVPADLRERYGKREITKALGTSDRRAAVVLCRRLGLALDDEFRIARSQPPVHAVIQGLHAPVAPSPIPPPPSPVPAPPAPPESAPEPVITGPSLADLAKRWEAERQPDWKSVTVAQRVVRRFGEMVGDVLPCRMTRSHAVAFKDALLASGQSGVNTNKHMTVLNVLLNYGVANGVLEHNPARGVKVVVKHNAKDARHPFALSDLQSIFTRLPVYAGGQVPPHIGQDAAYWIPLLALFYGARREELCQLAPDDVYEETYLDEEGRDGKAWVLRITDAGEGQQVKNIGSVRRVPLHRELIARGFLDFAARQRGQSRLFSRLKPTNKGEEGAAFGKWFMRALRNDCGITDPKLVFHSFRHAFKDQCRALLISEEVSDALSGHASGKVSRRYGGLTFPLYPLVQAVAKYRVPGLVLLWQEAISA